MTTPARLRLLLPDGACLGEHRFAWRPRVGERVHFGGAEYVVVAHGDGAMVVREVRDD